MIQVKNLSKNFAAVEAVKDISFSIDQGEIVGLLGPNGAGKTTTMRMLTGFYKPTHGSVVFDDVVLFQEGKETSQEDIQTVQGKIGYLPEFFSAYPNMQVRDFLLFTASARNLSQEETRNGLDMAVTKTALEKFFYRPISQLSKGYKQRVGLAAALLHDPDFLILDEPTSGLDPNQILEIQDLIVSLAKSKTIILSTHILKEVEAVCQRALIISGGRLVLDDSLANITAMQTQNMVYNFLLKANDQTNFSALLKTEFPDAEKLQVEKNLQTVSVSLHVKSSEGDSTLADNFTREKIFQFCVKHNLVLLELVRQQQSLENVFHQITLPNMEKSATQGTPNTL